jgi:hypothetical protein
MQDLPHKVEISPNTGAGYSISMAKVGYRCLEKGRIYLNFK